MYFEITSINTILIWDKQSPDPVPDTSQILLILFYINITFTQRLSQTIPYAGPFLNLYRFS